MKKLMIFISLAFCIAINPGCNNYQDVEIKTVAEHSTEITIEKARAELELLLDDINEIKSTKADEERIVSDSYTIYDTNDSTRATEYKKAMMHVFNFQDDKGFALMSASEESPSLYAFVGKGHLNQGDIIQNPGLGIFLEYLRLTIDGKEPEEPNIPYYGEYKVYGNWENIFYNKDGYCKVEWSQDYPHNALCPVKDNQHCLTGCTATAMAQFMSIFKHPSSHNGYSFNWDEMTAYTKARACSPDGRNQIARLMEQLGTKKNLNVRYGLEGSSAKIEDVPRTFNNFGYSNKGKVIDYNTKRVVEELQNGHSVLACGMSFKKDHKILGFTIYSTYSGGHTWICHGLLERRRVIYTYKNNECINTTMESQWYPLCNWGWNGSDNGFFLSGVFDSNAPYSPDSTDTDNTRGTEGYFQYHVKAVVGIRK